jgi:hypothetical protein
MNLLALALPLALAAAPDTDGDGVTDSEDDCIDVENGDQSDTDSDELGDFCDNCRDIANEPDKGSCGFSPSTIACGTNAGVRPRSTRPLRAPGRPPGSTPSRPARAGTREYLPLATDVVTLTKEAPRCSHS